VVALDQPPRSLTVSVAALVAAFIAVADDVLYILLIRSQGNFRDDPGRVVFVASYLAGAVAVAAAAAFVQRPEVRVVLLGAATGAFFGLGVLGALSIGLPLVAAGVLTTVSWIRAAGSDQPSSVKALAGALAAMTPVVLIAGIALT